MNDIERSIAEENPEIAALIAESGAYKAPEYFANLDEIEKTWRELREGDFPQKLRDDLWRLCIQGRRLFWEWVKRLKDVEMVIADFNAVLPKTVPAYQRAVVLLEHEKRWRDAIRLCEEANEWGIRTDWYTRRIEKLGKKVK